jgi:hypothetical protein
MISYPELQEGIYGNLSFGNCKKLETNKLFFELGIRSGSELIATTLLICDTTGQLVEGGTLAVQPYGADRYQSIKNNIYSQYYGCGKIQIFKPSEMDPTQCILQVSIDQTTTTSIIPKLNYLQLSSTTSVSLTYTYLPNPIFPNNNDTLIKIVGCFPSCYVPPAVPPIIPTATIFPNPTNNYVTLNVNMPCEFKLYSSDGKKLIDQKNVNSNRLDLSTFPNGIYFIIINSYGNYYKEKIIKKE